jgi:hypothetical protein
MVIVVDGWGIDGKGRRGDLQGRREGILRDHHLAAVPADRLPFTSHTARLVQTDTLTPTSSSTFVRRARLCSSLSFPRFISSIAYYHSLLGHHLLQLPTSACPP